MRFSLTIKKPAYIVNTLFGESNLGRYGRTRSNMVPSVSGAGWGGIPYNDTPGGPEPATFSLGSTLITVDPRGFGGQTPLQNPQYIYGLVAPDYTQTGGLGG